MPKETKTLPKGSIRRITITDGRVTNIDFNYKGSNYHATITPSQIIVGGAGKYKRQNDEFLWKTNHVCGSSGFMPGEYCPSCCTPEGYAKSREDAWSLEPLELPKVAYELSSECRRLETLLGDNGFL